MRSQFPLCLLSTCLLASCSTPQHTEHRQPVASTGSQFNALWNDSGEHGSIGFWLYQGNGSCPSIRHHVGKPLVFAPRDKVTGNSTTELAVKDMSYCFAIITNAKLTPCRTGTVRFTYSAERGEYIGNYALVLADGTTWSGNFRAQYCPKENSQTMALR